MSNFIKIEALLAFVEKLDIQVRVQILKFYLKVPKKCYLIIHIEEQLIFETKLRLAGGKM